MESTSNNNNSSARTHAIDKDRDVLHNLIAVAACALNVQIDAFTLRMADALFGFADHSTVTKDTIAALAGGNILRDNGYAFYYLASSRIENTLREAVQALYSGNSAVAAASAQELSLVPYEVMDRKVQVGKVGRALEAAHAEKLQLLNRQLAQLLGRHELALSENPFRPDVFVSALHDTWCEFDPDEDSHALVLPLLSPAVFPDLSQVYAEMSNALAARGILPDGADGYRIHKSRTVQDEQQRDTLHEQLQALLGAAGANGNGNGGSAGSGDGFGGNAGGAHGGSGSAGQTIANAQLLGWLSTLQQNIFRQLASSAAAQAGAAILSGIKQQAPQGSLSRTDETKIDLLEKVFDVVFRDSGIPQDIKPLIGALQVPVLKIALTDPTFFFESEHPARRLIELLGKAAAGFDRDKGESDPLYQEIRRNVERVHQEADNAAVFTDAAADFEAFIKKEEAAAEQALEAPIKQAVKRERLVRATRTAKGQVALRVGTGEVVAFVETFLEDKWVSVLTLAYSIEEDKPKAVESAIKTMDELVWSVKPKITMAERKELIAKLPPLLGALNKWLNLLKWDDAERMRFFAELAECHASIVRAPLELSPQRQVELAIEAAKLAAERREQKRAAAAAAAAAAPEPTPDPAAQQVEQLERGAWFEFTQAGSDARKFRLAWVSPLRSLYIFSTRDRKEAFSLSADALAQAIREQRARMVSLDNFVERALADAVGANDPAIEQAVAA